MKNNELLKKYAGISTRIRRIFAYHYDPIYLLLQCHQEMGIQSQGNNKSFINLRYQTYSNN